MSKDKTPEKKARSGGSYAVGVFFRLLLLAATAAIVLAVGHFKYGWQPLGPKLHADQIGANRTSQDAATPPDAALLSDAIREATGTPEGADAISSQTPTPTPAGISKEDSDALTDLLKKETK